MANTKFDGAVNPFAGAVNPFSDTEDDRFADAVNPFADAVNPFEKKSGIVEGFAKAGYGGAKQTLGSLRNTFNVITGDNEDVLEQSIASKKIEKTPEQEAFMRRIKEGMKEADSDLLDAFKNVGDAAYDEPIGALHEIVAQLPNSAAALGGMYAGAKTGAAIGTAFFPGAGTIFGTAMGTVVGGILGMYAGNAAIETGFIAQEKALDGDGFTDADSSQALKQGAIKAGVITGIDAATMGLTRAMFAAPGRAVEKAVNDVLVSKGVDITSDAAVEAAFLSSNALVREVAEAGTAALAKTMSGAKRTGRGFTAFSLEGISEGAGEYLGSKAAGLEASPTDAVMEGLMSVPQSFTELYVSKRLSKQEVGANTAKAAGHINRIMQSATIDDAINAANEEVDNVIQAAHFDPQVAPVQFDALDITRKAEEDAAYEGRDALLEAQRNTDYELARQQAADQELAEAADRTALDEILNKHSRDAAPANSAMSDAFRRAGAVMDDIDAEIAAEMQRIEAEGGFAPLDQVGTEIPTGAQTAEDGFAQDDFLPSAEEDTGPDDTGPDDTGPDDTGPSGGAPISSELPAHGGKTSAISKVEPEYKPTEKMSPVEVPLSELKLSDDIPQFKAGADKSTGVVTPLQGKFDRVGVTPIMVWERLDGSKEIITGRHRFELAQRSGEDTIPSYVVKESEGYTLANALQADAILNIRDNQGEVSDYARYFRDSGISKEEAQSEGALRLAKGQQGFDIASNSGELLFRYHQAGQLTDKQAAAIANAAPGNEQLQTLGIDQINNGRSIDVAVGTMQAVQAMQAIEGQAAESGDMFGFDDAAMKQAEKIARRVAAKKREIRERISAAKGAATRPDKAKEMGIDVKDPEGIKAKIKELQAESERLDSWTTNPELRAELIGDDAFTLTTKPAEQAQEDEAPAQQDDRTGNKAQSPKRFEQTLDDDFGPGKANQDMSASGIKRAADRASGKNYALETQTEESLAAEAKKQEEAKAQAAAQEQRDKQSPDDFVLTGSTSPVDEAEARGQTNLADLIGKNDERKEAVAKNINDESTPTIFTNDAGTLFYTVTRAPNGDKKYQVTVWDKDGPMSDSKHNTADEIIRHYGYGNEFKKDATQAEFDAYVGKANDAKAQVTAQEETPAESSSALPEILTMSRKAYISRMAKESGLRKDSPGYPAAMDRLEAQYEDDVDRAQAELPFEKFNELNSDNPESVNRSAYDSMREEFGLPAVVITAADIDAKANAAATSPQNDRADPTPGQIAADNYKKGEPFTLHGQKIVIENPRDSMRGDKETGGKKWSNKMAAHYGDIKGTVAADGDNLDVFVGQNPESKRIFIIDQQKKGGGFDEHKILMGFTDQAEAEKAYLDSYPKGWKIGPVSEVTAEQFKDWVDSGDHTEPYAESKPSQEKTKLPTTKADGGMTLEFDGKRYQVDSLADAATKFAAARDRLEEMGAGGARAMGSDIKIFDANNKQVARLSYNGRIWDNDGNELPGPYARDVKAAEKKSTTGLADYDPDGQPTAAGDHYISSGALNEMYTLRGIAKHMTRYGERLTTYYIGNLSTNFNTAVEKARIYLGAGKKLFGKPFELGKISRSKKQETGAALAATDTGKAEIMFTFGKHEGKSVADVEKEDPGYMEWIKLQSDAGAGWIAKKSPELAGFLKEYKAVEPEPLEMYPIDEVDAVFEEYGITVTESGDEWMVSGIPFEINGVETYKAVRSVFGNKARFRKESKNVKGWLISGMGDRENVESRVVDVIRQAESVESSDITNAKELRAAADKAASEELPDNQAMDKVSKETADALRLGLKFGIPENVVDDQIADVGKILNAYEKNKGLFLLANEAGTGKTFVLGGAVRELRNAGAKKFVYITMNTDLIEQIKKDLEFYGVDDIQFATYAAVSTGKADIDADGAVVIFDETHNVKNIQSARGNRGQEIMQNAEMVIMASATPFENPAQAEYMAGTGFFEREFGADYYSWLQGYGGTVKDFNGNKSTAWTGSKEDGKDARQFFFNRGIMTYRPMQIPTEMVESNFIKNAVDQKWVDIYNKVEEAYKLALSGMQEGSRDFTSASMHRVNVLKRILEASKVQAGIDRAKKHMADGKNPIIFVETKSDRHLGRFRQTGGKGALYTYEQMTEMMMEWERERAMAAINGESVGPPPFATFIYDIAGAFNTLGIDFNLPSTTDDIIAALGKDNVAIYTGSVTNARASKNLKEWRSGKRKVLVATMDKGGTGLSLHDTVGDHPTAQVNINLPWVATKVDQVAGRSARYGLQSNALLEWLFASNIPFEEELAGRVGRRMADMGAVVKGIDVKAAKTLTDEFDFEGEISTKQDVSIDDLIAKSGQKQAETAPDQAETNVPRGTLDIDQETQEAIEQPAAQPKSELQELNESIKILTATLKNQTAAAPDQGATAPVTEYPLADRGEWYADADYEARGARMVNMTPDEYLAQVRPLTIDEESRENIDLLKAHMQEGKTLDPVAIYPDGSEDGRHRAHAAKELGIEQIPVLDFRKQNLDDFGEKLGGSRADKAQMQIASAISEMDDAEIASKTLSQLWPKASIDKIESAFPAAFAHAARAEIPNKPRVKYKLDRWVKQVKMLTSFMRFVEELTERDQISRLLEKMSATRGLEGFKNKVELLQELDRKHWDRVGDVRTYPDAMRYTDEKDESGKTIKIPAPQTYIRVDGRGHTFYSANWRDHIPAIKKLLGETEEESSRIAFEIRGTKSKGYNIYKKGDSEYRVVAGPFTEIAEVRRYLNEQYDDVVKAWDAIKARDNVSKTDVRNAENKPRTGKDYRNGRDVRPEEFGEAFGFRGTEFGKWVGQGKGAKERQGLLNQAYDALMDLADIIGIPPKAISLNGELGLAFGSRGKGSASAHFEPDYLVINLTKTKGAGTFAHEWFHALDNYFQRKREITPVSRETRYITYAPEPMMVHKMGRDRMTKAELERRRGQHPDAGFFKEENWHVDANHPEGVRPEVERVFSDLVQRLDESPMRQRAAIIDKGKENGYWSRIIERAARSFENYIVSKMALDGYDNEYLANVKSWEEWKAQGKNADRYPYLEPDEIAPIAEAFDALFDVIETKETEKGVALFSRVGQRGYTYDGKESSLQGGGRIESSVPDIADGFAQGDLFIDESASGEEKAQQLKDHFATTTANRKIGELKTGTTQIKDEQDLAHLVASIRKKAQERFIVVVTDKDDNILMVSQHTTGLKDSSSVDPLTVVAQAAGIEGAANIHYAHNHPSGIAEPSGADRRITDTLERALDGTGIAQGMHVVVGDNGQAVEFAKSYENKFAITPRLRDKTVPIVERTLVKRGKLSSNISSPETAATAISAIDGDNVILLLDAQYAITGVVRLSVKEMSALREGGAVNRILSAIDKTNAAATIIKTTDKDAAANVSRMINEKGGRVLDVFAPDSSGSLESDASIGGTIAESRGAFFSQRNGWQTVGSDQNRGTSTVEQVRAAIKQALDKLNQEEGFGIEVVADMSSLPYGIRSQADPWSRYKGVYYKGKVYLIASSIGSARDARMTLAHELVGHKGVLEMASPEEWADIKKTIQGLIDRGSSTAKSISEEVDARYGRIDTETFYKEFLAVAMERRVNTGSVGKLVAKMKEIVRRFLKLYGLNTFSSSEIDIILSNAESYLKAAGEFSRLGGRTSFSQNTPGTFYSSLRMAAEKLMQDKGTPDQMLGAMRKIGGVKEEELEWTGLTDYLKGVGKTVTKQQIIDYLDANGVRVTPIVLGGSDDISNIAEKYGYEVDQDMGGESQFIDDEGEYTDFYDLPEEMRTELGNTNYMEPSYGDYVTPGGTNYREVLLTLPESTEKNIKVVPHPTKEGFAIQRADGSFVSVEDTLAHAMGSAYQDEGNNVPAQWETEYMAREYGLPAHDKDAYRGGHYGSDFPNVIAHIRMNDRVVPVHTEASIEDIERRIMQAVPAAKSGSSLGSGAPEMAVRKGLITEAEAGKYSHYRGYRNEDQFNQTEKVLFIEEIQSDWHQSGKKHGYKKGDVNSVPDAPFKGNAWVDLAVKQIYRIAAEGGYDRVAWTTGEQQADRYDLSRQIDSIAYIEKDGRYTFDAIKGNSVPFFKRGITIQEVEAALGKEIAQKMEQGIGITDGDYGPDWKELSGVDLKVGGEGMKSFYDKTLRNTFSTIGKKLDKNARVSPVAILTGEKYTVISDRPSFHSVHHQDGRFIKNYSTREEAERVARELPELVQMGVNITPAMRDSAMAGQSLFSKAKAEGYKGSDELLASRSPLSAFQPPSNRGASGSLPQILSGVEDRLDSFRFQVQDKLIDLKRAQDSIRASGANIDDSANAYRKAAIWEGKTGERLNDFDELSVQPLVARMADTGLDIATIGEWLVARHANEANTYLAEINPDKPDAERYRLAGMSSGLNPADPTDNEAAAILDRHSGNVALQDVGGMIDDINDHRVMMLVRDGLLTPQMASAWQGRYRHYVPLKREEADSLDLLPSRGQGFSLTGKESKMRTGSAYWTPAHIVTNTLAQMEASIVRAGKNDVDKALLELVEANPNPGFWEVDYDRVQKSVRGGKVVEGNKALDSPNELTVKKGGRDVVISFSPTNTKAMRLVTGMKNLSASDMGGIMRAMATVTRFLAQVNTSWNPEFIISNFFRDIQTAGYNLTSTELADAKKAVLKNTFSAINGIRSALFGDGSADWAPIWEDFRKHGGKTGWIDLHNDIKVRERSLQKTIDRMRAGGDYKGKMTKLLESVDDMNAVIENGVRLSAYKNALDRFITPGMTQQEIDGAKDRAAALAKDLTVNFNRRGNWGPAMNALYMFANASIQGSARLLQAMVKSKEGRKLAIATVGFAIFLDIVNRSLSGDDDDGENIYDNLPDYIKDHNLIFMGDKEPIVKIPLPWGYNVLHTIGQVIGESISSGRFNASESASRLASSAIDAFNPVGSGTPLQVISPTITDPLAMISENKTFMGTDLKPEHTFDKTAPVPEYQMHWSSARETSKFVAKWLNDNTGGNEVRPGDINVSPEWLELIWDTATGGLGRTVGNSTDVLARVIQGKPVPTKNIPFVRKVTGYDSQYGVKTRYYEWAKNAAYAKEELLTLKGKDLEDARKRPIAKIVPLYMGTEKTLKALRSARKGMVAAGADQERIDQIDERIRDVMANFNMQYAKKILD